MIIQPQLQFSSHQPTTPSDYFFVFVSNSRKYSLPLFYLTFTTSVSPFNSPRLLPQNLQSLHSCTSFSMLNKNRSLLSLIHFDFEWEIALRNHQIHTRKLFIHFNFFIVALSPSLTYSQLFTLKVLSVISQLRLSYNIIFFSLSPPSRNPHSTSFQPQFKPISSHLSSSHLNQFHWLRSNHRFTIWLF